MESGLLVVVTLSILMVQRVQLAARVMDTKGGTNWYPLRKGDVGYLAVLYKPQQKTDTHVEATLGQACGGALVHDNKVLTQCACMSSFLYAHLDFDKVPPDPKSPQDIVSKDIYVTLWTNEDMEFIADQKHVLDRNPINFMTNSTCYNDMKAVAEGSKNVKILQASIVVVMFSPAISLSLILSPAVIIPWSEVDQSIEPYIYAFGMSKKNESEILIDANSNSDKEFDPTAQTLEYEFNFFNESCPYTDYCKMQIFDDDIPAAYNETAKCLCMKQQRVVQLCKGVPGFPVSNGEDLIGVMASPIDCDTGSVMVYILDQAMVQEIDAFKNQDPVVSTAETDASAMSNSNPSTEESPLNPKITVTATEPPSKPLGKANPLTSSYTILFPLLFCRYLY